MIPDNVEKIIMTKEDYDRNVEQLLYDKVNAELEIERLNNIIEEVREYIKSKSIKFTMAYVEDDGRINLPRSDYRIDKLTSKQVKELLKLLDKENK